MAAILIVEDEPAVANVLAYVFQRRKHTTYIASTVSSAIHVARHHAIDAALIELDLKRTDGFAVCRSLRQDARCHGRTLPVWMMAGASARRSRSPSTRAGGAVTLLRKPFPLQPLLRDLEASLRT